jgi:hypothetical protein
LKSSARPQFVLPILPPHLALSCQSGFFKKQKLPRRQNIRRLSRVARFFLVVDTKNGKKLPNEYKMYQMVIKYQK